MRRRGERQIFAILLGAVEILAVMIDMNALIGEGRRHHRKTAGQVPDQTEIAEGALLQMRQLMREDHGAVERENRDERQPEPGQRRELRLQGEIKRAPAERHAEQEICPINQVVRLVQVTHKRARIRERELLSFRVYCVSHLIQFSDKNVTLLENT